MNGKGGRVRGYANAPFSTLMSANSNLFNTPNFKGFDVRPRNFSQSHQKN